MYPLYNKASMLTEKIIGAAVDVHHHFGPGLLESIYVKCLEYELNLQGLKTKREVPVKIEYKGYTFDESLRLDLLVEDWKQKKDEALKKGDLVEVQRLSKLIKLDQTKQAKHQAEDK